MTGKKNGKGAFLENEWQGRLPNTSSHLFFSKPLSSAQICKQGFRMMLPFFLSIWKLKWASPFPKPMHLHFVRQKQAMWFLWHKNALTTWESPYFINTHTHTRFFYFKKKSNGKWAKQSTILAFSLFHQDSHRHCEKVNIMSAFRTQLSLKYATSLPLQRQKPTIFCKAGEGYQEIASPVCSLIK